VVVVRLTCKCYCSDWLASEPVQCSAGGRVNAIAGANRQQRNQQQTAADSESSTATSDESSDDNEMDREPAETVAVESTAPCNVFDDVESPSVDTSADTQQQHIAENLTARNTEAVTVRKPACHIAVNRTAEIQVFCICYMFHQDNLSVDQLDFLQQYLQGFCAFWKVLAF